MRSQIRGMAVLQGSARLITFTGGGLLEQSQGDDGMIEDGNTSQWGGFGLINIVVASAKMKMMLMHLAHNVDEIKPPPTKK
jgi:hypothetical protein